MGIKERVEKWSDIAASKYAHESKCMDATIAAAAKKEDFNDEQIARVVQAANKKVFIKLFPQKHEFDVASEEGVKKMLNKQTDVVKKAAHPFNINFHCKQCSSDIRMLNNGYRRSIFVLHLQQVFALNALFGIIHRMHIRT